MKLDRPGLGFCAAHEACYLYGYPDPGTGGEPITDGIGHTARAGGRRPKLNVRITLAQAVSQFREDMAKFEKRVSAAVPGVTRQHQFNALVSFDFNTGQIVGGTVDDKLKRGDESGAMATLMLYVNAGGKRLDGLVTRRREEVALFRTGVYPARSILVKDAPGSSGRRIPWTDFPFDVPADPPIAIDPEIIARPAAPPLPTKKPKGNFLIDLFNYFRGWMK